MDFPLNPALDAHDTRILAELQADARLTMAELGRRVHLSQPAVTERVKKLEAAGVISGYRATVNLGKLGYGIRAIIRVGRADYARVVELVQQTPECVNAYNVTGDDS
ncbi:DNA-binding Lrp family transcriptional regulator [Variovorax paradoxus]|nr:DNA-binding Lrp family transcriptional regulator [Variovorax paradoxus]